MGDRKNENAPFFEYFLKEHRSDLSQALGDIISRNEAYTSGLKSAVESLGRIRKKQDGLLKTESRVYRARNLPEGWKEANAATKQVRQNQLKMLEQERKAIQTIENNLACMIRENERYAKSLKEMQKRYKE